MKNMKKIALFLIASVAFFWLTSCETDDDIVFVVGDATEVAFTNNFLSVYTLTPATAGNIGERFTWNSVDFGVPTNVTYELQNSLSGDFNDATILGTTSSNEIAVTIGEMRTLAIQSGLDDDPSTANPNTGPLHFRLKASIGTAGGEERFSAVQSLTVLLPEQSTGDPICEIDSYWLVGAGVPDAGWGWDSPVELPCTGDAVFSGNVNFTNDGDANFRFFTVNGDWGSGRNYPWFINEGYTIDANFEDAMDGDNNFKFVGDSGIYFLTVDANDKVISLGPPQATGVCELDQYWLVGAGVPDAGWGWDSPVQVLCVGDGIYSGSVNFTSDGDANFRFFTINGDWGSGRNYPWFVNEGYTIDPNFEDAMDGDNNFKFIGTTGNYILTVDESNKVIVLD
jgi:starch-binding outer membrane protein SusE/F